MGFFQRLFGKKEEREEIKQRDVFSIKIDDIVSYELEDYQAVGKLVYKDGNFTWTAYQLKGDGRTLWLSAEMDDELELGMYEKIPLKLSGEIPNKLYYDGTEYYLEESGSARVKGEGRGANVDGLIVKYYDFSDKAEESFLSVEDWGGEIEASIGWEIEEYEIKILAAS
ncbi:DUF4178 domain-containing protein [Bacillus marinisedimentorum]|uniref:DUF4178 domain-containing protein n=1 Tax=Bacillus marinisedimentorum TaxID=1821260 RepID=UPI0007E24521|nr:DUF4178 domain-containing protein [Bacillus marinisedimentorum]